MANSKAEVIMLIINEEVQNIINKNIFENKLILKLCAKKKLNKFWFSLR